VSNQQALLEALQELVNKWDTRIGEAANHAAKLRVGSPNQAYYYRGVSDGYKAALGDLWALLEAELAAKGDDTKPLESYVAVSQGAALNVLNRAGLPVQELHAHADHTFSAIFSALQALSFEELIGRLSEAGDIIVLDYGRLPNGNKPYVDFAFQSLPGSD
jgi:NAD-specific glutamate dehydrogenase